MDDRSAKICVPICLPTIGELRQAAERASRITNIIELRLDCLDQDQHDAIPEILAEFGKRLTLIVTLRAADQGGRNGLDYETRRSFWSSFEAKECLVDLEHDLLINQAAGDLRLNWDRVICSHHDFEDVPENLAEIYLKMASTPAAILKLAVFATDAIDCLPVFHLLDKAQSEGRQIIAIAMGQAGLMTRILGPSRGSFLTYASFDDESATAPGQLTVTELRELYRVDRLDRDTAIFGIIGKPVGHSISPQIHNAALSAKDSNAVYLPFEVGDATEFLRRMVHPGSRELDWNLRGLSVTAPHKSTVMALLDWIEPQAKEIGAVNTIVVNDDELHGYNTDVDGFVSPLREKFGSLQDAHCAVIGAGGAARAAVWALQRDGATVELFVRDPHRRNSSQTFGIDCRPLANARFKDFQIVINASPVGTLGESESQTPANAAQLHGVRLAYDLVYNPMETSFLRAAQSAGCETLSGLEMLLRQAVAQFKLWTQTEPPADVMRAAAVKALTGSGK